ncbi:MAG: SDR family oxidoreductase [Kofleriaceae bacterium]|nr:SDR family oxidoreductase [Myxococcales bacterium]MCB9562045.1 SDR family oxidoreductase [Kofleriaceae bacterium]
MNVVVTGATRGLGRALCDRFLGDGHRVCAVQRGARDDLAGVAGYHELRRDLGEPALVDDLAAELAAWGRPDLVVHSAVRCEPDPDGEVAVDELDRHVRVNAVVPCALSRALARRLDDAEVTHVFFGTLSACDPEPELAAYGASKLALVGLVRHLARTLADTHHRVASLVLGSLATPDNLAHLDAEIAAGLGADRAATLTAAQQRTVRRALVARRRPGAAFPDLVPLVAVHRAVCALAELGPAGHGATWRLDHGLEARL